MTFRVDAPPVEADAVKAAVDDVDEGHLFADDRVARFSARLRGRVSVRSGERLTLAVDHRELHLFDPASGAALDVDHAHVSG